MHFICLRPTCRLFIVIILPTTCDGSFISACYAASTFSAFFSSSLLFYSVLRNGISSLAAPRGREREKKKIVLISSHSGLASCDTTPHQSGQRADTVSDTGRAAVWPTATWVEQRSVARGVGKGLAAVEETSKIIFRQVYIYFFFSFCYVYIVFTAAL